MKKLSVPKTLMILGTSSGAGKSLMATALCRVLLRRGEIPVPFKGQNMSNNAWVDTNGGEMAYSQAVQAWAAGIDPNCSMNPILLKPRNDNSSEVIHLGQSVGVTKAKDYYEEWFLPGWKAIRTGLKELRNTYPNGRLVLEGAGSPVEMNLQYRDLTNLRLAQFLKANCILVADIERGGVFAQIIGTMELLKNCERKLIKGVIINRFRGDQDLFNNGRKWIEKKTGVPILGVMPWVKGIYPAEDSLDLVGRQFVRAGSDTKISVLKLPSISNFSDIEPLEIESTVEVSWIEPDGIIGEPDALIIPGSKQTISDLNLIKKTGLGQQIKRFAHNGGDIFGICGGMQMLGTSLEDPYNLEGSFKNKPEIVGGLDLLPLHTFFGQKKETKQRKIYATWPKSTEISGYELHHGETEIHGMASRNVKSITEDPNLGWVSSIKDSGHIAGCYIHGIFENDIWRRQWLNQIRKKKGLRELTVDRESYIKRRERLIERIADTFEENINMSLIQ